MHPIEWLTAQPLWNRALANGPSAPGADRFRRPALLRLAGDDFMQQVQARLATSADLAGVVAQAETWRDPGAGWLEPGDPRLARTLKLYQPAHGRDYLVAASLVCRTPGFPDRKIDAGAGETAAFVVRRLVPVTPDVPADPDVPSTFHEHGWVPGQGWKPATGADVLPGEERLPLFPLSFKANSQARRVLFGLLPAASRETFAAGPELSPIANPADDLGDPRHHELDERVISALRELGDIPTTTSGAALARTTSLFILLDLAEYLQTHAPTVWNALGSTTGPPAGPKRDLWTRLRTDSVGGGTSWATALREVDGRRAEILESGEVAGRPTYDLRNAVFQPGPVPDRLRAAVIAAFDSAQIPPPPASEIPEVPKLDPSAGALHVVRCVYERPVCAGIHPPAVSAPSQAFQLATFFDPDAPARQIRIQMPVDTSVKGLRKFPRAVSFLISDQLRRQMSRIQGIKLEDLDNGDIGDEGGFSLGMICSLSIPIITICALILLMIIVFVLNIVFWWIPFFRICLPLKLKAS